MEIGNPFHLMIDLGFFFSFKKGGNKSRQQKELSETKFFWFFFCFYKNQSNKQTKERRKERTNERTNNKTEREKKTIKQNERENRPEQKTVFIIYIYIYK